MISHFQLSLLHKGRQARLGGWQQGRQGRDLADAVHRPAPLKRERQRRSETVTGPGKGPDGGQVRGGGAGARPSRGAKALRWNGAPGAVGRGGRLEAPGEASHTQLFLTILSFPLLAALSHHFVISTSHSSFSPFCCFHFSQLFLTTWLFLGSLTKGYRAMPRQSWPQTQASKCLRWWKEVAKENYR